jgi:hypothetical protein
MRYLPLFLLVALVLAAVRWALRIGGRYGQHEDGVGREAALLVGATAAFVALCTVGAAVAGSPAGEVLTVAGVLVGGFAALYLLYGIVGVFVGMSIDEHSPRGGRTAMSGAYTLLTIPIGLGLLLLAMAVVVATERGTVD